ncbi:hypothetical protein TRVA0_027S00562 [Trichomonascus vanleenenianus]|uniref:uncharacterized protein n=1 Tax=Trichomonascus vanleenenianus TaxID=2268995 RepID=UPI003ECB3D7A
MAPPTVVMSRKDVEAKYNMSGPTTEITQFECKLKNEEVVCVPFTRYFRQIINNAGRTNLVEITDKNSNLEVDFEKITQL